MVGLFLLQIVFSQGCHLFLDRDSCYSVTSSSFNEFNLENNEDLVDFEARLYYKNSPSYSIPLIVEDFTIKQQGALSIPGVYVLELTSYDKAGNSYMNELEIVFDNSIPLPPVVPTDLNSINGGLNIKGSVSKGNIEVLVEDSQGNLLDNQFSDNEGNFNLEVDNLNSVSLLNFYSVGTNGIKSEVVKRVVYPQRSSYVDLGSSINVDDLSSVNKNTVLVGNSYDTTDREFYISGEAQGDFIYVNGIKTPVVNGRFGTFVHLNEGLTEIYLNGAGEERVVNVNYFDIDFVFNKIDLPSIVSQNQVEIDVDTNLNLGYLIYLNGEVISEEKGDINLNLDNLREGRNIVSLKGPFGKVEERVIHLDVEEPRINLLSELNVATGSDLVFKIEDDIGLDMSTLELSIGGETFEGGNIEMRGDYFIFSLDGFDPGNYNLDIKINDLSGKSTTFNDNLVISNEITSLLKIDINNEGYFLGDTFFFNSEDSTVTLTPTKNIAFKNIYVDDVDVIDYNIKPNYEIEINLGDLNSSGEIELIYIDSSREEITDTFNYVLFDEEPRFVLHGINSLFSNSDLILYGEIVSEHFNWDSLSFNSKASYLRKGNFVEVYLDNVVDKNLQIDGSDYGNNILSQNIGSLFGYSDNVDVNFEELSRNGVEGGFIVSSGSLINMYSYDSFSFKATNIYDSFNLPTTSRYGMRSAKLSSLAGGVKLDKNDIITVDGFKPIPHLVEEEGNIFLIVDGTGSEVQRESMDLVVNGENVDDFSYCNDKINSFGDNLLCVDFDLVDGDNLLINISDNAGNSIDVDLPVSQRKNLNQFFNEIIESNIYISGTDKLVNTQKSVIQGTYSGYDMTSISVDNRECEFDSTNFVCNVELKHGVNDLEVTANFPDATVTQEVQIIRVSDSINLEILNISGDGLFNLNNIYYYTGGTLNIDFDSNSVDRVEVLVNGYSYDVDSNINSINLDMDKVVSGFNEKELEVKLSGEDESGSKVESNSFTLLYKRLIETFVSVFVG